VAAALLVRRLAQVAQAVVVTARHQELQPMDQLTQVAAAVAAAAVAEMVVRAVQAS
jgi:hypothetical protein